MSFRRIGLLTGQSARSGLQAISARQCLGNLREFHLTSKLDRGSKNLDWFVKAVRKLDKMKTAPEIPPFPIETLHGKNRKRAYIDFKFGKDTEESKAPVSRIVVELADDIVPTTVANFLALSARGEGNGYIASEIFRVQKGFAIFGGDFESNDGRGGHSAFDARYFPDENFIGRHTVPGVLAMASSGVHSNGSVFYFTLAKAPHLDGRNVVFGRVVQGMDVLKKIESSLAVNLKPASPIVFKAAGVIEEGSAEWNDVEKAVKATSKSS